MHKALYIYEIVERSASGLDDKSVFALSLTCKRLCSVALDVLWGGSMLGIQEIFQPFVASGALLQRPMKSYPSRPQVFFRPLIASDWVIFLPYANRIKSILWTEDLAKNDVLRTLIHTSPQMPLFPKLRELTYCPNVDDPSTAVLFPCTLLLSPSLSLFSMISDPTSPESAALPGLVLQTCLWGLTFRCSQLKYLDLSFPLLSNSSAHGDYERSTSYLKWSSYVEASYTGVFVALQKLEVVKLYLWDIYVDVVPHLARLPKLRVLQLSLFPEEHHEIPPSAGVAALFPCLERLAIKFRAAASLPIVQQIAGLMEGSPLTEVELCWAGGGAKSVEIALDIFAPQTRNPKNHHLTSFTLNTEVRYQAPDDLYGIPSGSLTVHQLRSLSSLSYRGLTNLRLCCPCFFQMDDNDVDNLGQWLPNLVRLTISTSGLYQILPSVTIGGILSLSRRCAGLEELSMSALLAPYEEPMVMVQTAFSPVLREWSIRQTTLQQPLKVALTLARLFPFLVLLRVRAGQYYQSGEAINRFLEKTAELRRSETAVSDSVLQEYWESDVEG